MRLPFLPPELHTADRPSTTAQWTTLARAWELGRPAGQRIVADPYAELFLTPAARATLLALRVGGPVSRLAERARVASIGCSSLCRHRFIDEHLLRAAPDVEQVVLLGAGYDARAYRFRDVLAGRPVYEVDLPPTSRRKAAIVSGRPDVFGEAGVRRVEIDFRTQSLVDRLVRAGCTPGARGVVVWEGVAMYLSADAVHETLAALAQLCGPGSVLAMDCWQHVPGHSAYDQLRRVGEQAIRLVGEPVTFAAEPERLSAMLGEHGFAVDDLGTGDVLDDRYATDGRRCDEGLYVLAAVRD